jgi:hypothetical protein
MQGDGLFFIAGLYVNTSVRIQAAKSVMVP